MNRRPRRAKRWPRSDARSRSLMGRVVFASVVVCPIHSRVVVVVGSLTTTRSVPAVCRSSTLIHALCSRGICAAALYKTIFAPRRRHPVNNRFHLFHPTSRTRCYDPPNTGSPYTFAATSHIRTGTNAISDLAEMSNPSPSATARTSVDQQEHPHTELLNALSA